jgi:hypothetical protein
MLVRGFVVCTVTSVLGPGYPNAQRGSSEQWFLNVRIGDSERRIPNLPGEGDQVAVESVELLHSCVECGRD